MTTLSPRAPYSQAELAQLYPSSLELRQVQILLRHGERTPVSARFQNAGLAAYWPYCKAANELKSVVLNADGTMDNLAWRRRLETFGQGDAPRLSAGSRGEIDAVCQAGELTDEGRQTTLALGQRTRKLYVDQLGFLPSTLAGPSVALRSTPIQRALESTQQAFTGLYPLSHRAPGLAAPTIVTRSMQDETLFPNEGACKRFGQLAQAFANRAAQLWNDSPELEYVNKKVGKWMPPVTGSTDGKPQPVKVDSHPRLSGLMDTINATLAHGPATKLPSEFYDTQAVAHIDRICTEEWFAGYQESREYRKLGIGAMVGDLTQRMVEHVTADQGVRASEADFKLSLAGCHDTTLAGTLTAFGAFDASKDKWPFYTSSIAFELFKQKTTTPPTAAEPISKSKQQSWWSSLFSSPLPLAATSAASARTPLSDMPPSTKASLNGYFVRLRYNDQPVTVPFCRHPGNHLEGDESFCTLTAFKQAADEFTPKDWKAECKMRLGEPAFGLVVERPLGVEA